MQNEVARVCEEASQWEHSEFRPADSTVLKLRGSPGQPPAITKSHSCTGNFYANAQMISIFSGGRTKARVVRYRMHTLLAESCCSPRTYNSTNAVGDAAHLSARPVLGIRELPIFISICSVPLQVP